MFSHEMTPVATAFFCSLFTICFSRDLPVSSLSSELVLPIPVNESLQMDPMDRAALAALQIKEFLRNYTVQVPNDTDLHSSVSKKAAVGAPAIYLQETGDGDIRGLGDLLQTNLVPFIVDNVLNPLIKRVLQSGGSVYSYFYSTATTETPAPVKRPSNPPRRRRTTTPKPDTTTAPGMVSSSTTDQGRKLAEESSISPMVSEVTSTINPGDAKYRVRYRERSTTPSTRKPFYVPDEDDEDESAFLNKIQHT